MKPQYHKLQPDSLAAYAALHVGREYELVLLWEQYKVACAGHAGVVLLAGEPGIGKTHLLQQFAGKATQDGATVLQGHASQAEDMPPYLPFLEALGQYIRVTPPDLLCQQVAPVSPLLVTILPELAEYLAELPAVYPLPQEQARLRLYEAVGTFLEAIGATNPLVLLLDDLHWADGASLDLLCHVVRHHPHARLLIVGAYQEGAGNQSVAFAHALIELTRLRRLTTVRVEPLSAAEIEQFADSLLGGPIAPMLSLLLYAQSEGNPFFAEELLQYWIETHAIARRGEHWSFITSPEHKPPPSITSLLRGHIERLSPEVVEYLRVAAIIGRRFDVSLLAAVVGEEAEMVEEHLFEAVRARLIQSNQAGIFLFEHVWLQQYLYDEMSASRRRRLHETMGQLLESRSGQETSEDVSRFADLAFHFTRCDDRMRAATYARRAAAQALQGYALQGLTAFSSETLTLLGPDDQPGGAVLLSLGEPPILVNSTGTSSMQERIVKAWLSRAAELVAAARVAHHLALLQWRQETLLAAQLALKQVLLLQGGRLSAETVHVLVDLATLFAVDMRRPVDGSTCVQRILELAQRLEGYQLEQPGDRPSVPRLFKEEQALVSGVRVLERTQALLEASNDRGEAAKCGLYLAGAYYWMSRIRFSCEVSLRWLGVMEHASHSWMHCCHLAMLFSLQGAWDKAEQMIEQSQSLLAHQVPSHQVPSLPLAVLRRIRGFLAYQREDYEDAEQELQAAVFEQSTSQGSLIFCTGLLGLAQVAQGRYEKAHASITELRTVLSLLPEGALATAPLLMCLALMEMALGEKKRAVALYPRLKVFQGQLAWFLVDRILGMLATLSGDWATAQTHLTRAEVTAQREGLRIELARTLVEQANLEMARNYPGSLARAQSLLQGALTLFEELGLSKSADHIRNLPLTLSYQANGPHAHELASPALPAGLTQREVEVLALVAQGKSNRQIAQELGLSEKTIANHITTIFYKTASENRAAAAAFAIRHGLA